MWENKQFENLRVEFLISISSRTGSEVLYISFSSEQLWLTLSVFWWDCIASILFQWLKNFFLKLRFISSKFSLVKASEVKPFRRKATCGLNYRQIPSITCFNFGSSQPTRNLLRHCFAETLKLDQIHLQHSKQKDNLRFAKFALT